jgi:hypothetical protein
MPSLNPDQKKKKSRGFPEEFQEARRAGLKEVLFEITPFQGAIR